MESKRSGLKTSFTVRDLPPNERPREKMVRNENLTIPELLAVILGRGSSGESVLTTAQNLVGHFKTLNNLCDASLEQLMQVPGIGLAKACQIKAAFQLAERKEEKKTVGFGEAVKTPEDAAGIVQNSLAESAKEHFWAVLLNTRGRLIKVAEISKGSLDSSIVHPREVFKEAMTASAASVIFVHNHPSGITDPSEDDIKLTKRLVEVGDLVGIDVLDHVIIGNEKPFSLKRNGLI
jgi:DNA repair protein RadC